MTSDDPTTTEQKHRQTPVPTEFIPEGFIEVTNYTEEDLPTLAEDIAGGGDAPAGEILESLETLVHEYSVPVVEAERSMIIKYGKKEVSTIEDPDLPNVYGWDQ